MNLWTLVFLLAASTLSAGEKASSHFEITSLRVSGKIKRVDCSDLDGDGRADLLAVYSEGMGSSARRFIGIFWNREGTFSSRPDLVIPIADETCAFDLGNVDSVAGAELIELSASEVRTRRFRQRQASEATAVVRQPLFFFSCDREDLPRARVVQDLAAPGSDDLLVPGMTSLGIYHRRGDKFEQVGMLKVELETSLSGSGLLRTGAQEGEVAAVHASYTFPSIHLIDTDGDGLKDVVLTQSERIAIYRQRPGSAFPDQPDSRHDFAVATREEQEDGSSSSTITVADLDADGRADFLVHKSVSKGISSASTSHYLFMARAGGALADKPDQVIRREGSSVTQARLLNLHAGGAPVLMVPSVTIGLVSIVRMLTSQTLRVNFQFFPFQPQRRFAKEPRDERTLSFHLNLSGVSDVQAIDLSGDYNGDGWPDLVFGTGENELSVFLTSKDGTLNEDPTERLAIRGYGQAVPIRLSDSPRSDLALFFPDSKGHRGEITVLRNRGGW